MTDLAPNFAVAAPEGVEWSPTHLAVLDPGLSFEQWEELLFAAGRVSTSMKFWIGDLLNFGEARYGERYSQAMEVTGLAYSTLTNYRYVCAQVRPSRRRSSLRFSHHAEVASLEPEAQGEWLGRAEDEGWTVVDLREALRDSGRVERARRQIAAASRADVIDAGGAVDAARGLSAIREVLVLADETLDVQGTRNLGTGSELGRRIPEALRAIDEAGKTVRAAAAALARPALVESARQVVKEATRSSGFAMVPIETFEAFAAVVAAEE